MTAPLLRLDDVRPTKPHAACCRWCPSAPGRALDPMAIDVLASDDPAFLRSTLFLCGWRPERLCRGNWDQVQARLQALAALDQLRGAR